MARAQRRSGEDEAAPKGSNKGLKGLKPRPAPSFRAAIVGRPNVGKSTLFNRLAGQKLALVDDRPGVTRDRREAPARLLDMHFTAVDTAGLEEDEGPGSMEGRMRRQTDLALVTADIILFVVDARGGITAGDEVFAEALRRTELPVIVVANKAEGRGAEAGYLEAHGLGLGEAVPVSAEHGEGMVDLYEAMLGALGEERAYRREGREEDPEGGAETGVDVDPEAEPDPYDASLPLRIAVAGRPNAGKSTLVNRLLGEERLLTGPEAGLTRDSIAVEFTHRGRPIRMHDTAGLRKRARVETKLEKLSVADALRAVRFAEVVIVVLDATRSFETQDLRIADLVASEGRAVVIALNKWDLIEEREEVLRTAREACERLLPQLRGLRMVPVSAETGAGLDRLMDEVERTHRTWDRRVATARLNRWLDDTTARHPPPSVSGRRLRLKYATQVKARPPSFMVATTRPEAVPTSYTRYLVGALREDFDLWGVPVRIHYRGGDNPYEPKAKRAQVPVAKPGRKGKAAANAEKKRRRGLTARGRTTAGGKPRAGSREK